MESMQWVREMGAYEGFPGCWLVRKCEGLCERARKRMTGNEGVPQVTVTKETGMYNLKLSSAHA